MKDSNFVLLIGFSCILLSIAFIFEAMYLGQYRIKEVLVNIIFYSALNLIMGLFLLIFVFPREKRMEVTA